MKLKASTLIESLVAMTIIVLVVSICIISFATITSGTNSARRIGIHMAVKEIAATTKIEKIFVEGKTSKDNISYTKAVESVNEKGLIKIRIEARNEKGQLIEEYCEYILDEE